MLSTVFLAVLIDLMGFGIVLPLLPYYASVFHASPPVIGLLYSIYSFAQLVFSPLWGSLSDRIGRRPVMLVSTAGAVAAYLLFAFSDSLALLFLSRLIAGVMGGNIATAQAYIADVTPPEQRAKGMGLIGVAFGVGFMLGPVISTVLIHPTARDLLGVAESQQYMIPGLFAALMSLTSFLLVLLKLPESPKRPPEDLSRMAKASVFSRKFWAAVYESRGRGHFPLMVLAAFLIAFTHANLYSAFPLLCQNQLKLSAGQVGIQFALMGAIAIAVQGVMLNGLVEKFGETRLFIVGTVGMVIGLALIPLAPSVLPLSLFLGLTALGGSLNGPTLNSLISKEVEPSRVGQAMGTSQGAGGLGRALGPTWGGFLYGISYPLPFLVTAAVLSTTVWIGLRLKGARLRSESES